MTLPDAKMLCLPIISCNITELPKITLHSTYQKIGMWRHRDKIMKQLIRIICVRVALCSWLQ